MISASFPACYLAEQHGAGRRDFYFATEDVAGFERIVRTAAEAFAFPLTVEQHRLADVAQIILPAEAIGELGIDVAADARIRPTRFEFWGAEPSLAKLRAELERRDTASSASRRPHANCGCSSRCQSMDRAFKGY